MDARLFCAVVDVVDDIPGSIEQIQGLVGEQTPAGVLLAAAYHAARDVLPRNSRRVHFSPAGLAFAPDTARFPAALPPPTHLPVCAGRDVLAETVESARTCGVRSDAWVVYLHHDACDPGATAGRVVNAFGDVNPIALCPSAPETVQYASALTAQVCERGPDGVLAEALHHQTFDHGYHHERSFVRLGGLARTLLSLCLCPHCESAARARGLDVNALQTWICETVDGPRSADPLPAQASLCSLADRHIGSGTLEAFLGMRTARVTALQRACAEIAGAAGVGFVTMDPSEILAETDTTDVAGGAAWQTGLDASAIGASRIAPTFYVGSAAQARGQLDRVTALLGRAPAGAIVRVLGDDLDHGADLGATVSMLAAEGVGWVGYYHYGLAPTARLRPLGPIHCSTSTTNGPELSERNRRHASTAFESPQRNRGDGVTVSQPDASRPAAGLRPSDDLGSYRRAVDDVLRNNHDVWGEQVLALADGPTFEAVEGYLLPAALGDPVFLVESGAHYIVCTEPVGSESVALHVADGSQIVVDYIPTSATPDWAAAAPPRTRGGEHLLTYDFLVDRGINGDRGPLADLGSARLREGWLPILIIEYLNEEGVGVRRESFATRAAGTGDLVNYVRFDASDLGGRATVRVLTRDHRQAESLQRTDEFSLGNGGAELFLRLANGLSDDPVRTVTREEYIDARIRCTDYWSRTIAAGCVVDVPDVRVMDALRNLLVQNLVLGENYSIGNPYERTFLMEAHGATMPLLRYGYTERATECLDLLADMTNGPGPEWYESWERGTKLAAAAEHYRLCGDRDFIDRHSAKYLDYVRDFQRQRRQDPHGLLAPERYAWDIPEQVYGWHSQAVAWDGLRAIVPVLIECGHLTPDSDLVTEIEEFGLSLTSAMAAAASVTLPDGSVFVPVSLLGDEKPYESLTESRLSNYWNLVAPYAMATAIVPPGSDLARGLLRYLEVHGAWLLGLTRFNGLYDPPTPIGSVNEDGTGGYKTPGVDNAFGVRILEFLTSNGEADRLALALYGKLAHGMTRGTFVDGEATTIGWCDGEFYRSTWYPPNGTSNALLLDALRDLLVRERPGTQPIGTTVELGWATPRHWLRDGQHVAVDGLPTAFGLASFRIDSNVQDGYLDVTVGGSLTCPRMSVHVRVPTGYVVRSAVDSSGRTVRWDAATEAIVLEPKGASIRVRVCVEAVE